MSLGVDRVCVIIARTRHKMVQIELDEAVKRGAKFIELRLDFFAKAIDFKRLLPHRKCPWVATLRRHVDGGRYKGTEDERKVILRQAIVSGFDWVDLETDVADDIKRFRDVKRIVSYHNFNETPDELEAIYEQMTKQDADVLKVVTMAQHPSDCMRVLDLLKAAKKPTVGHCMGEIGVPSRVLSLRYGAPFMYAAFNKERGITPGLPSYEEVKRYFYVHDINAETKVYGVLGDPVAHSFSPALHNLMFRQTGINAVYLPFRVPRGELAESLQAFDRVPVSGYSVTIPHKEPAAGLAVTTDERVRETAAANTLVRRADGFHAFNTDYEAALEGLRRNMPVEDGTRKEIKGTGAMILGAGGAARAVAHALHRAGANPIWIAGRTAIKAEKLANEVHGKAVEWAARHNFDPGILVNCTPVGMHPNLDDSPVHAGFLKPGMVVFDTIYNPEQTLLIKEARARGCPVVTGVEMFVRQAAMQFELFTGQRADIESMREILRRALSPVTYKEEEEEEKEEKEEKED
jgi:3-dehydroquinate dehydratase / shikimate dehydrogenase